MVNWRKHHRREKASENINNIIFLYFPIMRLWLVPDDTVHMVTKEELGAYDKDPGGEPQSPPQVQALWETSSSGEAKHTPLCVGEM